MEKSSNSNRREPKSTERTTVRKIGENTYRIASMETRSAATGRFRLPPGTVNRFIWEPNPIPEDDTSPLD